MVPTYSPLRAYQVYQGISLHFKQPSYDYRKYGAPINRFTSAVYETAKGKAFYNKLYNRFINEEHLVNFLAATFFEVQPRWIGDVFDHIDEAVVAHQRFKKITQSPSYHAVNEMKHMIDAYGFQEMCSTSSILYNAIYTSRIISPESILVCDSAFRLLSLIAVEKDDIVQSDLLHRLHKYKAFITVSSDDLDAIKKACRTHIQSTALAT